MLFGFDSTGTAGGHAERHATAALNQQRRYTTGATYPTAVNGEYNYVGREQHTAQLAAQLYLSWFAHDRLAPRTAPSPATWSPGARRLPSLIAGTASPAGIAPFDESRYQQR